MSPERAQEQADLGDAHSDWDEARADLDRQLAVWDAETVRLNAGPPDMGGEWSQLQRDRYHGRMAICNNFRRPNSRTVTADTSRAVRSLAPYGAHRPGPMSDG